MEYRSWISIDPSRRRVRTATGSVEHDGLVAVHENAMVDVPAHRAGQDHLLQIATLLQQVVDLVAVRDADDVLFDDRPIIECLRDVVTGGPDELHPSLVRPVIRPRAA